MAIIKRAIKRKRRTRKKAKFLVKFLCSCIRFAPIAGMAFLFLFFQTGAKATDTVTIYVTPPIKDSSILPSSVLPSGYLSNQMSISATPGEFEPASFTVQANSDVSSMTVTASDLTSGSNTISSNNIDIKVVKPWRKQYNLALTPEILLNNDALVTTDSADTYLMVTSTNVRVSRTDSFAGYGTASTTAFPFQDAATLQPVNISSGTNKQFWITVKVPTGTSAGTYSSAITLSSGGITLKTLTLNVRVLPFSLATPNMTFGLFYLATLTTSTPGTISSSGSKNETQFTAEMQDMVNHGYTVSDMTTQGSDALLARAIDIRRSAGMDVSNFYYEGCVITSCSTSTMKHYADLLAPHGVSQVYIYGLDESDMSATSTITAMQDMHSAGIKIFDAQSVAQAQAGAVPSYLDTAITSFTPDSGIAALYHGNGYKVLSYANPQAGTASPETYRRNYGFILWQKNYDGVMDWAYEYNFVGNSYYDGTSMTFPTANGVIDTIEWEGMREGADDIKYLTTLQNLINNPPSGKSTAGAQAYLANLKISPLGRFDLNDVRATIVNYILYFLNQGPEPSAIVYATCGNNIKEVGEDCDGTDLGGKTCANFGYTGGTLNCRPISCVFDKSACTPAINTTESYGSLSDFNGGISNRSYSNIRATISGTADTSAYADGFGSDKTLFANWKFDETSGTTAYDSSGNGNNATLDSGDYGDADAGTTSSTVKETDNWQLNYSTASAYTGWTLKATSGAANNQTSAVSNYILTNIQNNKSLVLATPLAGLATGDNYHLYYDTTGPAWTTGKFGGGVQLDGIDDYVQVGSLNLSSANALTISAWILPSRLTGSQTIIEANGPFSISLNGNTVGASIYSSPTATWTSVQGYKTLTTGAWHNISIVDDGLYIYLYIDGALDNKQATQFNVVFGATGCTQIGRYNDGGCSGNGSGYFQGVIDDVMIFKRALSASEIQSLYNANAYPLFLQTGTLSTGNHSFAVWVTDTTGAVAQMATQTINVAPYSPSSDLSLNALGFFSTSSLKFLAGTVWDKFSARTSSTFDATVLDGNPMKLGTNSTPLLNLTPSGGELNMYFDNNNYLSSGGFVNKWTVSSSVENTQVATTIQVPQVGPNIYYEIKVNGKHYIDVNPDSSGNVTFIYGGGFSTKDFTIEKKTTPQGGYATSTTINGAIVNLIEFTPTSTIVAATTTPVALSTSTIVAATTTPIALSTASTAAEVLKEVASTTLVIAATSTSEKIIPPIVNKKITSVAVSEKLKKPGLKKVLERIAAASISTSTSIAPEQPIIKKAGIFYRIWEFLKSILRFFKSIFSI